VRTLDIANETSSYRFVYVKETLLNQIYKLIGGCHMATVFLMGGVPSI
jgi:Ni,Fe-hydrogenase III large subunit